MGTLSIGIAILDACAVRVVVSFYTYIKLMESGSERELGWHDCANVLGLA